VQTNLFESRSATEIFEMKIVESGHSSLYKEYLDFTERGQYLSAASLILSSDFRNEAVLRMLLVKCMNPSFPQTNKYEDDLDDDDIPIELSILLDEAENQSEENLDKITDDFFANNLIDEDRELFALNMCVVAANMGDEFARQDLLIYCRENIEWLEDDLFLFMFVDMLERGDADALEHFDYVIRVFRNLNMYESAYFYYRLMLELRCSSFERTLQDSLVNSLSEIQKIDVEREVLAFQKIHAIPNRHAVLKLES
jgi:hypothetical protein